jgi:hypothetical protein
MMFNGHIRDSKSRINLSLIASQRQTLLRKPLFWLPPTYMYRNRWIVWLGLISRLPPSDRGVMWSRKWESDFRILPKCGQPLESELSLYMVSNSRLKRSLERVRSLPWRDSLVVMLSKWGKNRPPALSGRPISPIKHQIHSRFPSRFRAPRINYA